MRLRALSLAAILIALPLSYEWVIVNVGPPVVWIVWKWAEVMTKAQLLALAVLLPIVALLKIGERWPRVGRAIVLSAGLALLLAWLGYGAPIPSSTCVQGWCGQ